MKNTYLFSYLLFLSCQAPINLTGHWHIYPENPKNDNFRKLFLMIKIGLIYFINIP